MTEEIFETNSADETREFGRRMAESISGGSVISLNGDLGVGKTVFTQGFAEGLEIDDIVNSPTFTILQVYDNGRLPFYHFDVYRIGDPEEMYEIGYEDYFFSDGVCMVEWADLIEELMPDTTIRVEIRKNFEKGFDYREIKVIRP